jgi:hypothetical protein
MCSAAAIPSMPPEPKPSCLSRVRLSMTLGGVVDGIECQDR